MSGRFILGALVALIVAGGAAVLGVAAYQAGIAQGVAQSASGTAPVVVYGLGQAGFGFGGILFGILGLVFLLFIIGGIARAMSYRHAGHGRWGGPGGWGGPGRWSDGPDGSHAAGAERWRGTPWETHARAVHDEWHRGSSPADPAVTPAAPASAPGHTPSGDR
jgi:hypothetical protein